MWPLGGEVIGRILWRSEHVGIRFVGAMLSVGLAIVGVLIYGAKLVKAWDNRRTH